VAGHYLGGGLGVKDMMKYIISLFLRPVTVEQFLAAEPLSVCVYRGGNYYFDEGLSAIVGDCGQSDNVIHVYPVRDVEKYRGWMRGFKVLYHGEAVVEEAEVEV